jgi:acetylornithine deacetylase/succinyl-diaminopimelate desuccinylase-like protein
MVPSQTVENALKEINSVIKNLQKQDQEKWEAEVKPFAIQHREPGNQLSEDHPLVKAISKAVQKVVPGQKVKIKHGSGGGRPDLFKLMPYASFSCKTGGAVHAPNEYVDIDSIVTDAKVIVTLMRNILE